MTPDEFKQKLLKGKQSIIDQGEIGPTVVYVHPDLWSTIPDIAKDEIKALGFEVESPSIEYLERIAILMGGSVDHKFWDPNTVYFVPKKNMDHPTHKLEEPKIIL